MYTNLNVRVLFSAMLAAFLMAASSVVYSQETDTPNVEISDSIIVEPADTLEPDPDWYVAPMSYDSLVARHAAPRRAAAADCPIDSIQIFDVDSVLTGVSVYEYGDTTRTLTWTVNSDGSRFGTSRTESGTNGNITFSASYEWDFDANDWKGTAKEEHTFVSGKETVSTSYDWLNGAWSANTQYTRTYDAAGRETEYTTYVRNANGALAYSKQRLREYNAAGKVMLDIQYTAHNGTAWSAGTKKVYDYDASNNQILYENYSAYTNGQWVGSSKEVWEYTAGKKTYYEKDTWSNGAWVGSSKEVWTYNAAGKQTYYEKDAWSNGAWIGSSKESWEYNASNKQTLHEKYGWANGDWAITLQENSGYDAAGNNTLIENYNYNLNTGVVTSAKKEEYTFNAANKKTLTLRYKWVAASSTWDYNTKLVNDYDAAGNTIETANYSWKNEAWVGTGNRTLKTYNNSKKVTEEISQIWSADAADWVNATRKTTEYEGAKTTQEASYAWQNDAWAGTSRSDWHYNTAGKNDTIKTYTYVGTEWIYSDRTAKTYNAAGTEIMVHNAHWDAENSKWVMTSMTRTDILDHTVEGIRQTLNASWRCDADSVWIGVLKDSTAYTASGKTLYRIHCEGWSNNDWVPSYKIEYEYDESDHILVQQQLNWVSGAWKGFYRYEYGYDEAGRQATYASYNSWSTVYNNWVGSSKTKYAYGSDDQIVESISYTWKNNDWVSSQKYIYAYDSQKRTIQYVFQLYANGAWVNSQKNEKDYVGEVLSKNNNYSWLNNQWVFSSRNESYYDSDAQAKLRREVMGSWNSSGVLLSFEDNHYFYDCDIPSYTIRFVNYDNTELASYTLKAGKTPSYTGETPSRPADGSNTYTFTGWSPAITAVTGDATYTAVYSSNINSYTITWLDENGSQIDQTVVAAGELPAHADIDKVSTAEYTYTFSGWNPQPVPATADATYQAVFTATKNSYTITWLNSDNSPLHQESVEYGAVPAYNGETPTKQGDAQYTYAFAGWDVEPVAVTGEATYTATFSSTVNKYQITFKNGETVLQSEEVEYGVTPAFNGETPTKQGDAQYTYAFAGWDKELAAVTGEATYNATFSSTVNKYQITFKNGETVLQSEEVEYGSVPAYEGAEPTKQGDAQYTYTFTGWDVEPVAVTGEATYTATFSSTVNKYQITFKNGETVLQSEEVEYGVTPAFNGETPTKQGDAQYTYTFAGWDVEPVAVTGEATYTAVFSSTVNTYTITWLNSDNSPLYQETVAYGETPVYTGETPTKQGDAQYTYTFTGWDVEPASVTGDATYTAVYSSNINSYTVTFYFEDSVTVLDSQVLEYGEMPSTDVIPSKNEEGGHYYYHFAGWSPAITAVTGDASYVATFTSEPKQYTITFNNYNGRMLWQTNVPYDETPEYNGEIPTRPRTQQYTYEFAGWDPELAPVTGNTTYTAVYEEILNQYTVRFLNEDGTELDRQTVDYGVTPEYQGETPTKEPDEDYIYTFAGWTPRVVSVTMDATYTATYTRRDRHEALDNVQSPYMETQKVMINGTLYILRGDKVYTADGVLVE